MKLLLPPVVVGAVLCLVLFLAGVISPSGSRRWQRTTSKWFRKVERKGDESAGRAGDMTSDAFRITRQATEPVVRKAELSTTSSRRKERNRDLSLKMRRPHKGQVEVALAS